MAADDKPQTAKPKKTEKRILIVDDTPELVRMGLKGFRGPALEINNRLIIYGPPHRNLKRGPKRNKMAFFPGLDGRKFFLLKYTGPVDGTEFNPTHLSRRARRRARVR